MAKCLKNVQILKYRIFGRYAKFLFFIFSRVATKSNLAYNMLNVVRASTFSFPRLPPLTIRHVYTKFHLEPTFRSYQIFVLFLEVVTLTFVLRSSIGGSLLILMFVGQRSRSICSQLGFLTFVAFLIFLFL
jgi:hypothetical protein